MLSLRSVIKPANRWFTSNQEALIRGLAIAFVLLFALVLSPRVATGHRLSILIFLMCMTGLFGVLLLRWPMIALIITILGGAFIPLTGPGGVNLAAIGVALMIGLWLFGTLIRDRRINIQSSRTLTPVFIFILLSIISFIIGQFPWFVFALQAPLTAQVGGFAIFLLSAGTLVVIPQAIKDIRWLKAITWTLFIVGGFYILGRAAHWRAIDRVYNLGFSAGSLFWVWLATLAFGQVAFNKKLSLWTRGALVLLLGLTLYVALVQANDWKSGWLPPLAGIAAIIGIKYWRKAILLSPFALIVVYFIVTSAIGSDEYSWGTRIDAWLIVLEISRRSLIFGLGFANYYWYTPLFPIRGYEISFNSHSQYVDIIAQTGILGLLCFLWIFVQIGFLSLRLKDQVPEGFEKGYVYGAMGGIVGTLVAAALVDWVLPFVYNIGFNGFRASILAWIFMGGLVYLEHVYASPEAGSAP